MKRILAIDNDKAFLTAICRTLEYNNYKVATLLNPLQTMDVLNREKYDCVLLDVAMPGINGLELLKQIAEVYPLVPVIMVSGESSVSITAEAIRQGAYYFLEKPIETKQLLVTIRNAIENGTNSGKQNVEFNAM